jgi:hypothetical protein
MALISIPAVYDGRAVILLETPPSREPYRVLVTFVEPADAAELAASARARFLASFGAWQDERPVEATLGDIREGRASRAEPPAL